jgi:hypothetical protein
MYGRQGKVRKRLVLSGRCPHTQRDDVAVLLIASQAGCDFFGINRNAD